MKHTPAPWFDDGYRIYAPTESDDKRDGRVIVEYKHIDGFNPADAPLLKASPDLLQALESLIERFEKCAELSGTEKEFGGLATASERAVVARAKGESNE